MISNCIFYQLLSLSPIFVIDDLFWSNVHRLSKVHVFKSMKNGIEIDQLLMMIYLKYDTLGPCLYFESII